MFSLTYFYYWAIIFISSLLQGVTGFGFALLATPLGLAFFDQKTLVVTNSLVSIVLNAYLSQKIKTPWDKKIGLILILSSFFGAPFGMLALILVSANNLKLATGILAFVFAIISLFPNIRFKLKQSFAAFAGFLTGFLQTSIGFSAPPIVLFLNSLKFPPNKVRKILSIVFLGISLVSIPLLLVGNLLTQQRLLIGLGSIPFVILGSTVGHILAGKLPKKTFRLLNLALIIFGSVLVILSALE